MCPFSFFARLPTPRRAVFLAVALAACFSPARALAADAAASGTSAAPAPTPFDTVPTGVRLLQGPPVSVSPQSSNFRVDAPDYPSALRVLDMADRAKTVFANFFTWPDQPATPIRIQLIPADRAGFTAPYALLADNLGRPTVIVRWSPETTFPDMCRALSGVILHNLVYWQNGSATSTVPDWLTLGFAALLEVNLKPPVIDALTAQANQFPKLALRQIMLARDPIGPDIPVLEANAYWLITFLDGHCANRRVARALFDALADNIDPPRLLGTAFPDQSDDPRDLELWWQVGYRDELVQQGAPIQTFAETRALLDNLELVPITGPTGPQRLPLDQAWPHHADKDLTDAIAATLINEVDTPGHANPAYKNAVVSLLRALEQFRGDNEKNFRDAWQQYQTDRAEGEAIEKIATTALATPP